MESNKKDKMPKGVFMAQKKDKTIYYRASCTISGKHVSLGSFATKDAAAKAYKEAVKIITSKGKTNAPTPENYNKKKYNLSFFKYITLINYRDNGIYIKTPIYMKKRYFEYYLDEKTILKFDVDDLFFYSTHSIMKRDGHLFVADYGMQLNIKNRYGIKNFAVKNKDYVFINGDDLDYRYGNILIINKYNGVTKVSKKGKTFYAVKIHVNGDYVVGVYEKENDAAIAYNKAVDYLEEHGISKNYSINFIEDMNSLEYAARYSEIKLRKTFTNAFK